MRRKPSDDALVGGIPMSRVALLSQPHPWPLAVGEFGARLFECLAALLHASIEGKFSDKR